MYNEMKSFNLQNIFCNSLKFIFNEPYINERNIQKQIGIVKIQIEGNQPGNAKIQSNIKDAKQRLQQQHNQQQPQRDLNEYQTINDQLSSQSQLDQQQQISPEIRAQLTMEYPNFNLYTFTQSNTSNKPKLQQKYQIQQQLQIGESILTPSQSQISLSSSQGKSSQLSIPSITQFQQRQIPPSRASLLSQKSKLQQQQQEQELYQLQQIQQIYPLQNKNKANPRISGIGVFTTEQANQEIINKLIQIFGQQTIQMCESIIWTERTEGYQSISMHLKKERIQFEREEKRHNQVINGFNQDNPDSSAIDQNQQQQQMINNKSKIQQQRIQQQQSPNNQQDYQTRTIEDLKWRNFQQHSESQANQYLQYLYPYLVHKLDKETNATSYSVLVGSSITEMTECFLSHDCQPSDISEKVIMKILAQFGEDDDYNGVDEDEIELQQQQLKDIHSKIDQERFNRKIGRNGESQQQLQILQQISNINNNINVNIQTSKDLIDNLPVRIIHPMNLLDRKGRAHIINQGCQLFLMRYLMHKKANLTVLLFLITLRKKGESINSRIMNANYNNRKTSNERDTESRDAQIQVMVNPQQQQLQQQEMLYQQLQHNSDQLQQKYDQLLMQQQQLQQHQSQSSFSQLQHQFKSSSSSSFQPSFISDPNQYPTFKNDTDFLLIQSPQTVSTIIFHLERLRLLSLFIETKEEEARSSSEYKNMYRLKMQQKSQREKEYKQRCALKEKQQGRNRNNFQKGVKAQIKSKSKLQSKLNSKINNSQYSNQDQEYDEYEDSDEDDQNKDDDDEYQQQQQNDQNEYPPSFNVFINNVQDKIDLHLYGFQFIRENPNPFRRILAYTSAHFISRNIAIQQQAASLAVLLYKAHPKTTIVHLKRVFIPANVLLQLKQEISQVRSQLGIDVCEQEVEREIWEEDQKEQEMRGLYQDEGNADEDDDDNDDDIQWSHEGRMDRLRDICLDWKAL